MVRTGFTTVPQSLAQVTALENELDAAHAALDASSGAQSGSTSTLSSRAVQAKAAASAAEARALETASALQAAEASQAKLAEDNEMLQERVSAMQAQVGLSYISREPWDHDRSVRGDVSACGTIGSCPASAARGPHNSLGGTS